MTKWLIAMVRFVRGLRRRWDTFVGRMKLRILARAKVGTGVSIRGRLNVKVGRGGVLIIGDYARLNAGFDSQPFVPEFSNSLTVGPGGRIEIGPRVAMSATAILAYKLVSIGEGTYLGGGVRILDGDGHSLDPAVRGRQGGNTFPIAPVRIGKECFIGGLVVVLKGVTIGDHAVIGVGSVVTKDVPPRQIWAGNPARFIKELPAPQSPVN